MNGWSISLKLPDGSWKIFSNCETVLSLVDDQQLFNFITDTAKSLCRLRFYVALGKDVHQYIQSVAV